MPEPEGRDAAGGGMGESSPLGGWEPQHTGRWPANLIHDGSDEVVGLFPIVKGGIAVRRNSGGNTFGSGRPKPKMGDMGYGDAGQRRPVLLLRQGQQE